MAGNVGLSLIHEPDTSGVGAHDTAVDIVFIHGLGSSPSKTWTANETGTFWPKEFLPKSIPSCRILVYGYQSQVTDSTKASSILTHAGDLLEALIIHRSHNQKASVIPTKQINSKFIFVCHSLGGLVVQQALITATNSLQPDHRKIRDAISAIVFLGTPHHIDSSSLAKALQYSEPKVRHAELTCAHFPHLKQTALHFASILQEFQYIHPQKLSNINTVSFFEELPIPGIGLVVDYPSALSTPSTLIPLHANHETICRFKSFNEPNYLRVVGELKKFVSPYIENRSVADYKGILRWLQIDNGGDTFNPAPAGTGNWFLNHREFKSWVDDRSSILWIKGNPASGKTILLSSIIQTLKTPAFKKKPTIIAYHYFHHGSSGTSPSALYQSLLFQILSQNPSVMSDFTSLLYEKRHWYTKPDKPNADWKTWMSTHLIDFLEEIVKQASRTHELRIFVDGLDECREEELPSVLSLLSLIDSTVSENPIKLCISSRPCPYQKLWCHPHHRKISLEYDNVTDIQQFAELQVAARFPQLQDRKGLAEALVEKASGTFLWVELVLNTLSQLEYSREIPESLLLGIPSNLQGFFQFIYDRIVQKKDILGTMAKRALRWVTFARRPLLLKELEVALGVCEPPHDISSGISPDIVAKGTSSPQSVGIDQIINTCGGLLVVRGPNATVQLVHQTVRDFLLSMAAIEGSKLRAPTVNPLKNGNILIAEDCVLYLSSMEMSDKPRKSFENEESSFLEYAVSYWAEHAKLADSPGFSQVVLLKNLRWPSTKVLDYWAHLYHQKARDGTRFEYFGWTALHASAAFGLQNLALVIFEAEQHQFSSCDIGDAVGRTPLSWAAEKGHISIAKLLLQKGASIATRDTRHGLSPLQWAALQGNLEVVKLLLEAGASPDENVSGCTALSLAAARGHEPVLKILLDKGATPNLFDMHSGCTPLHLSAGYGNEAAVSQLLAHGANPNLVDKFRKQTPLYYAISGSHHAVVKLLLDHGGGMRESSAEPSTDTSRSWPDRIGYSFLKTLEITPRSSSRSSSTTTQAPSGSVSGSGSGSHAPIGGTHKGSNKTSKKRSHESPEDGADGGDGDSGDGPNKKPALGPNPTTSGEEPKLNLACPYFKHDPGRYGSMKLCHGPVGWPTVARLKDHLYKRHWVKVCSRCCSIYKDNVELEAHYKATTACTVKLDRNYADGFDDNQERRFRPKKRGVEEVQYWKMVYQILFPTVGISSIPSPWYENVSKKSYDESCASARLHDPLLRNEVQQLVGDPTLVGPLLDIINRHQSVSVRPAMEGHGRSPQMPVLPPQGANDDGLSMYQPAPFDLPSSSYDGSVFPQMPWMPSFLQPPHSQSDSGFWTDSSAITEGDGLEFAFQATGFGDIPLAQNSTAAQISQAREPSQDVSRNAPGSLMFSPTEVYSTVHNNLDSGFLWDQNDKQALDDSQE
ncbi:uncharacterized protein BP5553_09739 [Venustampulla echinocandica]|uniref:Uncharacterized protein n=1 Tax=Venustampulla echinocandica TaxID=2656787 RepID=A0A370TBV7_9HELO|nr:uncharacterized protein BP5553_09739 [Venustampulla echinocandica]RDL31530.1 hypothetical protein BP5553_09739 [Venustampulla echinocandica]